MYISIRNIPDVGRRQYRKKVPQTVVVLGFVSLLTDISTEMITAALPLFVTVGLGLTPMAFGVIDSVYQAGTAVARIGGGYAADRLRRPKGVAVTGYGLGMLSKIMLLPVSSLTGLSAAIGVDRLGKGIRTGPRDALIANCTAPDVLGRSFGVHRALDTTGALLGPVVAFYLLLIAPANFDMLFVVSACIAAMGVLLLMTRVARDSPTRPVSKAVPVNLRSTAGLMARNRSFRRLLLVAGGLALMTISDAFVYLALLERGLVEAKFFPLLFVATSLVYLVTAIPVGRLADRFGRIRIFLIGHALILLVYMLVATAQASVVAIGALGFLGLYYAATDGVLPAATVPMVPAALRSTAISTVQTAVAIGRSLAALGFGMVWTMVGATTSLWIFAAGMAVVVSVAAPFLLRTAVKEATT